MRCGAQYLADKPHAHQRVMIFYHVAAVHNWQHIVESQLSRIMFSGFICDRATAIVCGLSAHSQEDVSNAATIVTGYGTKLQVGAQGPGDE